MKDALSYLDSVKIQFNDRPQIYNNFLDIMCVLLSSSPFTAVLLNWCVIGFLGLPVFALSQYRKDFKTQKCVVVISSCVYCSSS